ncbi:cell wall teichoic acid glycosylation protein GtcA [Clostridium polyendosporum]|uniref:Cell wall teichoic acid glycosylation protein GtcA n=1 Tax=Clostridium polyendosporum TaxID=69208 RepID=A0A919VGC5_9CLOT|nr:GtrA family protein [Clostridium polyendosporum]GIM29250.1 cell wall teichoic acid glycosylation protein GtcA [Clostridium polyendosporum]
MKSIANAVNYFLYGKLKHISRFSVVGMANTFVDFLMFTIFHGLVGLSYITSQVIGYSFGIANSFILNRKWTFEDKNSNKKTFHELVQFIVVNLISLSITIISINFLVKGLNLNVYVSKVIATIISQITNFLAYKFWVFS